MIVDDLASRVLVLGLPAGGDGLGEWLTAAAPLGVPFYATLHQLVTMPVTVWAPVVYVCENPGVLRAACGALGPRRAADLHGGAAVDGVPPAGGGRGRRRRSAALSRRLRLAGRVDRGRGDRQARRGAMAHVRVRLPRRSPRRRAHVPLSGAAQPTPWDPPLAKAMTAKGRAVYEESVTDPLIADLASR